MIVSVLEYPQDDQAQVFFVDTNHFDSTDPIHAEYLKAIQDALNAPWYKSTSIRYQISYSYGEFPEDALAELPCLVDHHITLYIE